MIDPRISLTAAPTPNVGQRFGQALTNLQNIDVLNTRRDMAPLLQEQAQLKLAGQQRTNELGIAQQPALIQQAERAGSGLNQSILDKNQLKEFDLSNAKRLKIALDTNDTGLIGQELLVQQREIQQLVEQGQLDEVELLEINQAIKMADIPEGLDMIRRATTSALTPVGSNAIQSSQFIPGKGFATLSKSGEAGFQPVAGVGETVEEKRTADIAGRASTEQLKSTLQGKSSAVKAAVNKGAKAFDKIQTTTTAINNYDEAIAAIDAGAETGVIDSLMPSFRKASIELDNVVKRLGLDVVGNTTFGALSESELKFALKAAIPDNLQPADLKQWLTAKRDAQKKVKERVEEAASFLSTGTHTLTDWIAFDQARQLNIKNKQEQPVVAPATTQGNTQQIGRFTVEVVN